MSQPDISYIVSNYNSAEFLTELLVDLLERQSHKNIEVIVVDSASTDNSVQILEEYNDSRLRWMLQDKRTPYGVSWLEGWLLARGKVVANSNTDDRSYPWRSTQVLLARAQAKAPTPVGRPREHHFYYGGYETHRDGCCIARGIPPAYTEEDLAQFFRCGVHIHWDNDIRDIADWDRMFQAGEEYKSAFDYWLVLYLTSLGADGISIPQCFSIYNQRNNSLEQSNKERNTFESMRAIIEFYPGGKVDHDLEVKTKLESPEFYQRYQEFCKNV